MLLFSFIYLHSNLSNKVRKPTGYRTSINGLNGHTHTKKKIQTMFTVNTLLQIHIKK